MAMTVTTAHHSIWKHLYDGMHTAQKPKVKFMFVALDKERNMSTLWRREVFLRICSEKDLAKIGAQKIEVTIPVTKNVKEHVTTLIQCPFFKIISAVNEGFQIVYTLEFEVSINRHEGFQEVKTRIHLGMRLLYYMYASKGICLPFDGTPI